MNTATDAAPDTTILAAIERAAHHRARSIMTVPVWAICEHLDIPRRSGAARHLRVRLDVLEAAGILQRSRANGIQLWALTPDGAKHLERERQAQRVADLPESPQHRAWRNARTTATQEINRFRDELTDELQATLTLLTDAPDSDLLFARADELHDAIRRLASATYCAHEWAEPHDAHPDLDTRTSPADQDHDRAEQQSRHARRHGRRNIRSWTATR